jgi:hypothetical protein
MLEIVEVMYLVVCWVVLVGGLWGRFFMTTARRNEHRNQFKVSVKCKARNKGESEGG